MEDVKTKELEECDTDDPDTFLHETFEHRLSEREEPQTVNETSYREGYSVVICRGSVVSDPRTD